MVMTSYVNHKRGGEMVQVRILQDTVCALGPVSKDAVVVVPRDEYYALKAAHKAVLATPADLEPVAAPEPEAPKRGKK